MERSFKEGKGRVEGKNIHASLFTTVEFGDHLGQKSQTMKNKAENLSETELSIRTVEANKINSNKPPKLCNIHPRVQKPLWH